MLNVLGTVETRCGAGHAQQRNNAKECRRAFLDAEGMFEDVGTCRSMADEGMASFEMLQTGPPHAQGKGKMRAGFSRDR